MRSSSARPRPISRPGAEARFKAREQPPGQFRRSLPCSCLFLQPHSFSPSSAQKTHLHPTRPAQTNRVTRTANCESTTSNSLQANCTSPDARGTSSPWPHSVSITCPGSNASRLRTPKFANRHRDVEFYRQPRHRPAQLKRGARGRFGGIGCSAFSRAASAAACPDSSGRVLAGAGIGGAVAIRREEKQKRDQKQDRDIESF